MRIAIIDVLGLAYDGSTLNKRGLGGSESAVISISRELVKLGHTVTVYNNCITVDSSPGTYDGVEYIPYSNVNCDNVYDVIVVSRSVSVFLNNPELYKHSLPEPPKNFKKMLSNKETYKVLWMHDTFCDGDEHIENLVIDGHIDSIFTLSDWHTTYISNCDHGKRRNFDILKKHIFQTRNGINRHKEWVDITKKDPNLFVYNSSLTKGMLPLVNEIWPKIVAEIPNAKLSVIGGYYNFGDGVLDEQGHKWHELKSKPHNNITFTGVIPQRQISDILERASFMIYPCAFPETFGISTLEALAHNVPLITCNFGAMEETAIDSLSYKIDYPVEKNWSMQWIDEENQCRKFVDIALGAYKNKYLHQQKMYACNIVNDICGWDTVARQWEQYLYYKTGRYLPKENLKIVQSINRRVSEVFGRKCADPIQSVFPSNNILRISIVTPTYNSADYIISCIESVITQDYDNWDMTIIDDASDDCTFDIISNFLNQNPSLPISLIKNHHNVGALSNQVKTIDSLNSDVIVLLDGDDTLRNDPYILSKIECMYLHNHAEFTYGSCWSMVDNIPLIAQEYPPEVIANKSYREYSFNWGIPYTHLRTFSKKLFDKIDRSLLYDLEGNMFRAGGDSALFYALIEKADPDGIVAVPDIWVNYNDAHDSNDYKINHNEQIENARIIRQMNRKKKILIAIPTNDGIEPETFKSIYDLDIPLGYETEFQTFHGYRVDQIRNLISDWTVKGYDYLFSVDHDIVLPKDALVKLIAHDLPVVSGVYRQRIGEHNLELYDLNYQRIKNIPQSLFEIGACGFGCVLVKKEILDKVGYPQFEYHHALNHDNTLSEDVDFCKKVRSKGYKIYADPSILCGHIGKIVFEVDINYWNRKRLKELYDQDLLPEDYKASLKELSDNASPDVIYDIGSCVMHWTRHAKSAWPDSKIICFEAMNEVKFLYDGMDIPLVYGSVLSNVDGGTIEFYQNLEHPGGNSIFKENPSLSPLAEQLFPESSKVIKPTRTLDSLIEEYNLPLPHLIKMDVQGSEYNVLRGAEKALKSANYLILELQHKDYNMGAPQIDEVVSYLDSVGFDMMEVMSRGALGADADYLFVKR